MQGEPRAQLLIPAKAGHWAQSWERHMPAPTGPTAQPRASELWVNLDTSREHLKIPNAWVASLRDSGAAGLIRGQECLVNTLCGSDVEPKLKTIDPSSSK